MVALKRFIKWFVGPSILDQPESDTQRPKQHIPAPLSVREMMDAITRPAVVTRRERYVCGFAFHGDRAREYDVVLIRKNKPAWQAGKLNGVGGKIEPGETPEQAMAREFKEEAGVFSSSTDWAIFARCIFKGADVIFLRSFDETYVKSRTMTAETIEHWSVFGIDHIPEGDIIPNLRWLIPLAWHFEDTREVVTVSYGQN